MFSCWHLFLSTRLIEAEFSNAHASPGSSPACAPALFFANSHSKADTMEINNCDCDRSTHHDHRAMDLISDCIVQFLVLLVEQLLNNSRVTIVPVVCFASLSGINRYPHRASGSGEPLPVDGIILFLTGGFSDITITCCNISSISASSDCRCRIAWEYGARWCNRQRHSRQRRLLERLLKHLDAELAPAVYDGTPPNPTESAVSTHCSAIAHNADGIIISAAVRPRSGQGRGADGHLQARSRSMLRWRAGCHHGAVAPQSRSDHCRYRQQVGRGSVIVLDDGLLLSPHLLPKVALCDPELTLGLPPG